MKKEDFMAKIKKGPKKKSDMSDPEQAAILKVLESMSMEAGKELSGKISIQAKSKEEAQELVDKAEEAVDSLPDEDMDCGTHKMKDGEMMADKDMDREEYMDDDYEEDEEEEYDEEEGDYYEEGMADFEAEPEMPSEKFEEDDMRDFSGMSEDQLDDEIEKLTKMRERMKIASMN